ncbi:unnamed protein product [Calypogeia fissa]
MANVAKETVADDSHVSNKDVAAGLIRMGILPRVCYLLEVDQLIAVEEALLNVLICLARHPPTAASAVMTCPRLIDAILQRFIGTDKFLSQESWSSRVKALWLLKVQAFETSYWVSIGTDHTTFSVFNSFGKMWCIRYPAELWNTDTVIDWQVEAIPDDQQNLDSVQWQDLSLSVLSRLIAPICRSWLFYDECVSEDAINSHQLEVNVLDSMMSILKDSESIPSYVITSGKAGLYVDLIFFLQFGSVSVLSGHERLLQVCCSICRDGVGYDVTFQLNEVEARQEEYPTTLSYLELLNVFIVNGEDNSDGGRR